LQGTLTKRRNTMTTRTPQIHLFGNLGGDPATKTLPGRTFNRDAMDQNDVLDRLCERSASDRCTDRQRPRHDRRCTTHGFHWKDLLFSVG
jgi:hypothetical protein